MAYYSSVYEIFDKNASKFYQKTVLYFSDGNENDIINLLYAAKQHEVEKIYIITETTIYDIEYIPEVIVSVDRVLFHSINNYVAKDVEINPKELYQKRLEFSDVVLMDTTWIDEAIDIIRDSKKEYYVRTGKIWYRGHEKQYETKEEVTLKLNLVNAKLISHHIKNNTLLFAQQHNDMIQNIYIKLTEELLEEIYELLDGRNSNEGF